jgi:hypothetical protein
VGKEGALSPLQHFDDDEDQLFFVGRVARGVVWESGGVGASAAGDTPVLRGLIGFDSFVSRVFVLRGVFTGAEFAVRIKLFSHTSAQAE